MSAVHHVAPVKSHDHIAALESRFLGGPFRLHIGHDRALHIGKAKDLAQQGRNILRRSAEEPADNTTGIRSGRLRRQRDESLGVQAGQEASVAACEERGLDQERH